MHPESTFQGRARYRRARPIRHPDKYPIGTVAELRATEFGVTYYLIKQANGSWRQITPPFINYGDLSLESHSVIRSTLTILYNPDNDKSHPNEESSTMNIIQIPTPPLRQLARQPTSRMVHLHRQ